MVVFVDYDNDAYDDALYHLSEHARPLDAVPDKPLLSKLTNSLDHAALPTKSEQAETRTAAQPGKHDGEKASVEERQNLNVNSFSAALSCYPYGI